MQLVRASVDIHTSVDDALRKWSDFPALAALSAQAAPVERFVRAAKPEPAGTPAREGRIAWRAAPELDRAPLSGVVTFQPAGGRCARVTVQLEYGSRDAASALLARRALVRELVAFKTFVETRRAARPLLAVS
jgi:uncharacterized membrane protein